MWFIVSDFIISLLYTVYNKRSVRLIFPKFYFRTEVVLHELYLQLRRDILDDRIQPKRDLLYDLAAFALQSEYSDQPNVTVLDYFDVQHYIPKVIY